jgi:hypothetical protein
MRRAEGCTENKGKTGHEDREGTRRNIIVRKEIDTEVKYEERPSMGCDSEWVRQTGKEQTCETKRRVTKKGK